MLSWILHLHTKRAGVIQVNTFLVSFVLINVIGK